MQDRGNCGLLKVFDHGVREGGREGQIRAICRGAFAPKKYIKR